MKKLMTLVVCAMFAASASAAGFYKNLHALAEVYPAGAGEVFLAPQSEEQAQFVKEQSEGFGEKAFIKATIDHSGRLDYSEEPDDPSMYNREGYRPDASRISTFYDAKLFVKPAEGYEFVCVTNKLQESGEYYPDICHQTHWGNNPDFLFSWDYDLENGNLVNVDNKTRGYESVFEQEEAFSFDDWDEEPNTHLYVVFRKIGEEKPVFYEDYKGLSMSGDGVNYDFTVDGIFYKILSDEENTCAVANMDTRYWNEAQFYSPYSGDVDIPSEVTFKDETYKVTKIYNKAFEWCLTLKSVVIPDGVDEIRCLAFESCYWLKSVVLPNTLTTIGWGAFWDCLNLEYLEIPSSVTEIGYKAFEGCDKLKNITIPAKVNSIGEDTFKGAENLTEMTCLNVTPPATCEESFNEFAKENCVLRVPMEAVEAYRNAEQWRDFKAIVGIETNHIEGMQDAECGMQKAYNLAGQRVSDNYRGIVVKNGKKGIVK